LGTTPIADPAPARHSSDWTVAGLALLLGLILAALVVVAFRIARNRREA
jgi:hypothetical protein